MTEQHRPTDCETVQELLPEFALGSLSYGDADSVIRHVQLCQPCLRELAGFQLVTDALLVAPAPVAPSESLRRRVLTTAGIAQPAESSIGQPRQGFWNQLAGLFRSPVLANRFAVMVAFVGLLVLGGLGYRVSTMESEIGQLRVENLALVTERSQQDQEISSALKPGVIVWELRGTDSAPSAKAALFCNKTSKTGLLTTTDLPPLPETQVYQVWLITDGRRTNGGLLIVDRQGEGVLMVKAPEPFSNYQAVGVTVEPLGGSEAPTGPRVLGGQLY